MAALPSGNCDASDRDVKLKVSGLLAMWQYKPLALKLIFGSFSSSLGILT
jgi:hypothetical protein